MRELWDALARVLEKEADLHESLIVAAEHKRNAIIEGDLSAMETLLRHEQNLAAEIEAAERERIAIVEKARAAFALPAGEIKLVTLIEKADSSDKTRLQELRERLREILNRLRYRTRQNAELLKASLDHVHTFLKLVAEAAAGGPRYDRNGRRASSNLSLLDRSA